MAAPQTPAGTAAPGESSSSLSSTSCGRVSDPALCRPDWARGRALRARRGLLGLGSRGRAEGAGGRALGGASRTGRELGGPGMWGRARGELAESFPQPGNERRARGVGARGAAHSCLLALTLRMSSRPLPAQVPHLSLHPV